MEQAMQAAALCVIGALLAVVVKRGSPETALLVTLAAAVAVLLFLSSALEELTAFLKELAENSGVSLALFGPLYKTVAIALVVKVGAGLCRDAGESALASVVETAGAVCALLVSLPLLRAVLELLMELMG
ncbi:SpoIIIAC/SpoIIIAD family protein [Dysosmobacter sp.]|uniref:SpoIIIAC/SpoIIIAD family protein n=1 Tax=Dysosmobacter sp. TaxID=2591382 RepID=UPI002A90739D|nr:SpoIIIAC/SpoIIIAD family protein [Dysosmobacter sp.]MDY3986232.1 SpoIIIAC/SpoIIIAD family protein [Dysosmobacter sp.]